MGEKLPPFFNKNIVFGYNIAFNLQKGVQNDDVMIDFAEAFDKVAHNRLLLIESIMELRPRQGNLRLVFRLFSLMRGLPKRA